MNHILIAYFSRAGENYFGGKIKSVEVGNTEICAKELKKAIEADLFKIEMKEPYSDNYKKCVAQAMKDATIKKRPELKKLPESIEPYDTIVLGYPNYCGSMPQAVTTFLTAFDFTGKKILPFCTNEGSGMGRSEGVIKKLCPTAEVKEGLPVHGSMAAEAGSTLADWVSRNI